MGRFKEKFGWNTKFDMKLFKDQMDRSGKDVVFDTLDGVMEEHRWTRSDGQMPAGTVDAAARSWSRR